MYKFLFACLFCSAEDHARALCVLDMTSTTELCAQSQQAALKCVCIGNG